MKVTLNHKLRGNEATIDLGPMTVHKTNWLKTDSELKQDVDDSVDNSLINIDNRIDNVVNNKDMHDGLKNIRDYLKDRMDKQNGVERHKQILLKGVRATAIKAARNKVIRYNLKQQDKEKEKDAQLVLSQNPENATNLNPESLKTESANKIERVSKSLNQKQVTLKANHLREALNIASTATSLLGSVAPELAPVLTGTSLLTKGLAKTSLVNKVAASKTSGRNVISKHIKAAKKASNMSPDELVKYARDEIFTKDKLNKLSTKNQQAVNKFLQQAKDYYSDPSKLSNKTAIQELTHQVISRELIKTAVSDNEAKTITALANLEKSLESDGLRVMFNKKTAKSLADVIMKLPKDMRKDSKEYQEITDSLDPLISIKNGEAGNLNIDITDTDSPVAKKANVSNTNNNVTVWSGNEPSHDSTVFKFYTGQLNIGSGATIESLITNMQNDGVWMPYVNALKQVTEELKRQLSDGPHTLDDWYKYNISTGKIGYDYSSYVYESGEDGSNSDGESKGFLQMLNTIVDVTKELIANVPEDSELKKLDNLGLNDFSKGLDFAKGATQLNVEQSAIKDGLFDYNKFKQALNK